jgi:hypothetical protein
LVRRGREPGELSKPTEPKMLLRVLASDTIMAAEAMPSPMTSEAVAGDPAPSTGPAASAPSSPPQMVAATTSVGTDDNIIKETEVIMRQLGLRALGIVSLSEAMGTTHFVLNQAHDVLCREREDIDEEWLRLSVWVSLLKKRTTSEERRWRGGRRAST